LTRISILSLLLTSVGYAAEPVDRIDLICTEQPMRHVIFGEAGQVDYREEPPRETAPVRLSVIKADPTGMAETELARIESDTPDLTASHALWFDRRHVDARDGKFRLDLQTNVLSIAETGANAETLFRRFTCAPDVSI
jgi:hypothetical protein